MALRTPLTVSPHMYIGDSTGRPLDLGMVYFGEPDKDPQFYPIDIFSDDELTVPVSQPVRTKGGYLNDNKGDMAEIHAEQLIYSVKVLDQYGRKIFYKGQSMRSNWNDDVIIRINEAVADSQQIATDLATSALIDITNQTANTVNQAIEGVAIDANLVTDALTPIVPITNSANTRTQLAKNRESVSIFDFMTKQELDAYNANPTVDSSRAIQEFFNYITINNVGTADASGDFYIGSGLELNGALKPVAGSQSLATRNIVGSLRLEAKNAIDTMLKMYNCSELNWNGRITVIGRGSTAYSSRTCRVGVDISRSGRATLAGIKAQNFSLFGVSQHDAVGNTSAMELGEVITRMCGSGMPTSGSSLTATYSARNDVPNIPSPALERSHLTVDVLPNPDDISGNYRSQYFVRIAGSIYTIMETDHQNSVISVHPIITENTDLTGSVSYIFGGGVNIRGSDSGIQGYGMIDAINCGIGIDMCSLYGPVAKRVISQSNGIGLCVGLRNNSAMVSYSIGALYSEGNYVDILQHTQAASDGGYFIGGEYALSLSKVKGSMRLYSIMKNGRLLNYEKKDNNSTDTSSKLTVTIDRPNQVETYLRDFWTIDVRSVSEDLNRLFGYDSMRLFLHGSGAGGTPTGSFTFNPPTGWTINGSPNPAVFSNFNGVAVFSIVCYMRDKDVRIACTSPVSYKGQLSVTATSVPANDKITQSITVDGVAVGDWVQAAYTQPTAGLLINAYVSAANTVTVGFINPTASPISLTAGSIKVKSTKL